MDPLIQAFFIFTVWFGLVPIGLSLIVTDILNERIFQGFLAWIDLHFRGGLIAYLFRCPRCLSHWAAIVAGINYIPAWRLLPFPPGLQVLFAFFATLVNIRITLFWVNRNLK